MKSILHNSTAIDFAFAPPVDAALAGNKSATHAWPRPEAAGDVVSPYEIHHRESQLAGRLSARHWIVLPAFGQSLLFLVFWLFWCTMAGASVNPAGSASDNLQLQESTYQPRKTRDPFASFCPVANSPEQKSQMVVPVSLKLQGILYQPGNPSAIINNHLMSLNKTVIIPTENGQLPAKAIRITKELVVVEVGGQTVKLFAVPKATSQ